MQLHSQAVHQKATQISFHTRLNQCSWSDIQMSCWTDESSKHTKKQQTNETFVFWRYWLDSLVILTTKVVFSRFQLNSFIKSQLFSSDLNNLNNKSFLLLFRGHFYAHTAVTWIRKIEFISATHWSWNVFMSVSDRALYCLTVWHSWRKLQLYSLKHWLWTCVLIFILSQLKGMEHLHGNRKMLEKSTSQKQLMLRSQENYRSQENKTGKQ